MDFLCKLSCPSRSHTSLKHIPCPSKYYRTFHHFTLQACQDSKIPITRIFIPPGGNSPPSLHLFVRSTNLPKHITNQCPPTDSRPPPRRLREITQRRPLRLRLIHLSPRPHLQLPKILPSPPTRPQRDPPPLRHRPPELPPRNKRYDPTPRRWPRRVEPSVHQEEPGGELHSTRNA